jgi:SAM-dependent methyltransferase
MRDSYDPEVYDLFHPVGADDSDIRFFRAWARETGGPILELGAGTGRTLLPLARDGIEVEGLDTSAPMLDALRARLAAEPADVRARTRVHCADMCDFDLERRFAGIQIPFRAFLHNVDRAAQEQCLGMCRRHLAPGGKLAFSFFHPLLEAESFDRSHAESSRATWRWRDAKALPDGGFVVLSQCRDFDLDARRMWLRLRYERCDPSGRVERVHLQLLELACLYPRDVEQLLRRNGFDEIEIRGGFDGAPLAQEGRELIVTAKLVAG